ncbi:MAG TPA: PHB depolymerase family esterase [Kiritimatiellia bacterium]|nr:PHB depolymerase family esterase [Kiritimatiellia bacterium]
MKTLPNLLFKPLRLALPIVLTLTLLPASALAMGKRSAPPETTSDSIRLTGPASSIQIPGPGSYRRIIEHDGQTRFVEIYAPPSYRPGVPTPLVFNFHGGGGSPDSARRTTGFNDLADQHGFLVAYPAGSSADDPEKRLTWNVLVSQTFATSAGKDDLGFIRALLDDLPQLFTVDPRRIYATGMSQGGMLCYRIACDPDLSARFAAIAPVAAVMTVDPDACNPARFVSILHIHGADDEFVPFAGGVGPKLRRLDPVERPPVMDTLRFWIDHNDISATPLQERSAGEARLTAFGPEGTQGEVRLWNVGNAGHTWPGGESLLPAIVLGRTSNDINASELIWDFFRNHRLD